MVPGVGTPSLLLESSGDVRCMARCVWLRGPLYQACRLFFRGVSGCSWDVLGDEPSDGIWIG
jgi:hypothetical protein